MIKKIVKRIIYRIPFKMNNTILMESSPTFSDNTRYVFNELIKRKINEKYKIYWLVNGSIEDYQDIKISNVYFVNRNDRSIKNIIQLAKLRILSKYIIECNIFIHKLNYRQYRIHLTHGMFLKLPIEYCGQVGNIDCITTTSVFFERFVQELFNVEKRKIIVTGLARNDALYSKQKRILYPEIKRNKTIIWMPTYRNHKSSISYESRTNIKYEFGVPCIMNEAQLQSLNDLLIKSSILLIIKLHPAEDKKKLKSLKLSNIRLLEDDIFDKEKTTIYDYLNNIDALITDYSSIYYDYLLTGNPIGIAVPDLEEYSKHMKLFTNNLKKDIIGEYIYNFEDLKEFITNVYKNNDVKKIERNEVLKRYHKYNDGNSSSRIVDILEEKMKERKYCEKRN